jgi:hypothetical protein
MNMRLQLGEYIGQQLRGQGFDIKRSDARRPTPEWEGATTTVVAQLPECAAELGVTVSQLSGSFEVGYTPAGSTKRVWLATPPTDPTVRQDICQGSGIPEDQLAARLQPQG